MTEKVRDKQQALLLPPVTTMQRRTSASCSVLPTSTSAAAADDVLGIILHQQSTAVPKCARKRQELSDEETLLSDIRDAPSSDSLLTTMMIMGVDTPSSDVSSAFSECRRRGSDDDESIDNVKQQADGQNTPADDCCGDDVILGEVHLPHRHLPATATSSFDSVDTSSASAVPFDGQQEDNIDEISDDFDHHPFRQHDARAGNGRIRPFVGDSSNSDGIISNDAQHILPTMPLPTRTREKRRLSILQKMDRKVSKWHHRLTAGLEHKLERVRGLSTKRIKRITSDANSSGNFSANDVAGDGSIIRSKLSADANMASLAPSSSSPTTSSSSWTQATSPPASLSLGCSDEAEECDAIDRIPNDSANKISNTELLPALTIRDGLLNKNKLERGITVDEVDTDDAVNSSGAAAASAGPPSPASAAVINTEPAMAQYHRHDVNKRRVETSRQSSFGESRDDFDQETVLSSLPRHMRPAQRSGSITLGFLRNGGAADDISGSSSRNNNNNNNKKASASRSASEKWRNRLQRSGSVSVSVSADTSSSVASNASSDSKMSLLDTALYKWSSLRRLDAEAKSGSELSLAAAAETFKLKFNQYLQRGLKGVDTVRKLKSQIWTSVVTVVIVEAKDLTPRDQDGTLDPYCRFRMGNEKYRSKTIPKTTNPKWLEQFDLHLYDDQSQLLEVTLWDHDVRTRDEILGRCTINLSTLEREHTHRIKKNLEEGSGSIFILLTITGTTNSETISDLTAYHENPKEEEYRARRYNLLRTWHNLRDVGHLTVKVYKAQGLAAADLGGKSDPFCVLELVNARLQTQTEYKTLCPSWQKIFTFNVKDVHSVLEVTVYDEDRDNKVDFLGKVAIPLLRIRNGEKKWYALKDKKLRRRAKGTNPQILLEMSVTFNSVRASLRTFDPAEEKYMACEPKFKREIFVRNVMRLKNMAMAFVNMSKTVSSWLEWENPARSICAFLFFMVATYSIELYMVPIVFLAFFAKNYMLLSMTNGGSQWDEIDDMEEDEEGAEEIDEEKKTWKEKLQAIQEVTQTVQNVMGDMASMWERTLNIFTFTVPFLSFLAIFMLCAITLVLYVVPLRALIFVWGVLKFTKKLIRPHALNNNEMLDFLSRVPDGEELIEYRELKLFPRTDSDRRRENKKSRRVNQ